MKVVVWYIHVVLHAQCSRVLFLITEKGNRTIHCVMLHMLISRALF